MSNENWVGIDIGGANLKFASHSKTLSIPFEVWKAPQQLSNQLALALKSFNDCTGLAITMTAELADCFESRQAGVGFICDAVDSISANKHVRVYQTTGNFVSLLQAKNGWLHTAASNWHATANWISKTISDGIVVDIGSTTTDIIPISNGRVAAIGNTDFTRLINNELVYQGTARTPVPTLLPSFNFDNNVVSIARELFATVRDAYIVLGLCDESNDCFTADGRPADKTNARRRLAKLLCLDVSEITETQFEQVALQIHDANLNLISNAIKTVADRVNLEKFIVLGEGAWLAIQAIKKTLNGFEIIDFFENNHSTVGPAYAVYRLICQMHDELN